MSWGGAPKGRILSSFRSFPERAWLLSVLLGGDTGCVPSQSSHHGSHGGHVQVVALSSALRTHGLHTDGPRLRPVLYQGLGCAVFSLCLFSLFGAYEKDP